MKSEALADLPEPCVLDKAFVRFSKRKALANLLPLSDFSLALQNLKFFVDDRSCRLVIFLVHVCNRFGTDMQ